MGLDVSGVGGTGTGFMSLDVGPSSYEVQSFNVGASQPLKLSLAPEPLVFERKFDPTPNLQSLPRGTLNLGVPDYIAPMPKAPLSLGQQVAEIGFVPALDQKFASFSGGAGKWISNVDLERGLANISANNPALSEGERGRSKLEAHALTVERFGARVAGNALDGGIVGLRLFTNPDVRGQAWKAVADNMENGPLGLGFNVARGLWNKVTDDQVSIEDKVADFTPSPSSWLSGAKFLASGGGLIGALNGIRQFPSGDIYGITNDTSKYIVDRLKYEIHGSGKDVNSDIIDQLTYRFVYDHGNGQIAISNNPQMTHQKLVPFVDGSRGSLVGGHFWPTYSNDPEKYIKFDTNDTTLTLSDWTPEHQLGLVNLMHGKGVEVRNWNLEKIFLKDNPELAPVWMRPAP